MQTLDKIGITKKYQNAASTRPIESYFLYGAIGTGKTYEASALAREANRLGMYVRFYSAAGLFNALRSYDPHDGNDYTLECIKNGDVLVIDDLGKEKLTEWKYEQLFDVIDHRYNNEKTTIITSNYLLSELAGIYGDNISGQAIVSRLAEMCKVVDMGGKDRRLG